MAFSVLIPAAGRSTRMGRPKAWLTHRGTSLLQRIVNEAAAAEPLAIVVVAGSEDEEDEALVARIDVAMRITTPNDTRLSVAVGEADGDLIASIRAGYQLVQEGSDLLLWPVDVPFGSTALVQALVEALAGAPDRLALPVVSGQRGHPVLFGTKVAAELMTAAANGGAHDIVHRDPNRVLTVSWSDARVVAPLNTPDDARKLGIAVTPRG
jgi:molybdenum cofactor cytidylyltransferase